jgi:hypothetical protein
MAYSKNSFTHYDDNMEFINRLAKLNNPFIYGKNISLAVARASSEEEKRLIQLKHDLLDQADAVGLQITAAAKTADTDLANLRNSIGMDDDFGKESDEYVFAGGIRPSEIAEKRKITQSNKKKGGDDNK